MSFRHRTAALLSKATTMLQHAMDRRLSQQPAYERRRCLGRLLQNDPTLRHAKAHHIARIRSSYDRIVSLPRLGVLVCDSANPNNGVAEESDHHCMQLCS